MKDIPELLALINAYAAKGIMLPRTEFEMAENLRDFTVIECGGRLAACGALHFYTPESAEVRSLAVDPAWKGRGFGKLLMGSIESDAQQFEVATLFAFTYIPDFFRKHGFVEVDRGALPLKAWKDCLRCPKFQHCDEIAVFKSLAAENVRVVPTPTCGDAISRNAAVQSTPLLPQICEGC